MQLDHIGMFDYLHSRNLLIDLTVEEAVSVHIYCKLKSCITAKGGVVQTTGQQMSDAITFVFHQYMIAEFFFISINVLRETPDKHCHVNII
jgi:hypothetical protein